MKQTHTILLTFWLVSPEGDRHEVEAMRELGSHGVFEPAFQSGERKMLAMTARFDAEDHNARISAALYAMRNAKLMYGAKYPECRIWGVDVFLNGEKLTSDEIQQ